MYDVWLRANTRPFWMAMLIAAPLAGVGGAMCLMTGLETSGSALQVTGMQVTGMVLAVVGLAASISCLLLVGRPRLAYQEGRLLVYLRFGAPIKTPVEIVEAFFLGQGETHLPGPPLRNVASLKVVVRLAERATDWAHRDVNRMLGDWSDGYISLRGAWTEPLSEELLRDLNHRLANAKRSLKSRSG